MRSKSLVLWQADVKHLIPGLTPRVLLGTFNLQNVYV